MDVVAARDGPIYIADSGNQLVRKVADGRISTVVGGGPRSHPLVDGAVAIDVSVDNVSAVALDNQQRLILLASGNGIVGVWRLERPFVRLLARLYRSADLKSIGPTGPTLPLGGLAVARDGTIFVADRERNLVLRLSPNGSLEPYAGNGQAGYSDGGSAADAMLHWPIGLAIDKRGNLLIADALNNRIRKVDPKGTITTIAGSGSFDGDTGDGGLAVDARLSFPFGVAVANDGTIVIADTGNHRLRRISTDGLIDGLAGSSRWGYAGDGGPALQAELNGPEAVVFDFEGDLLIADTENQRVREIPRLVPPSG
jgi:sugar lactone lactonase YvrE